MERIAIGQAQQLTSPNPFALISTCDESGRNNLMALSWWSYLSNHPATIGICLSQKGFSGQLIQKNREFCLCVPGEALKEAAFRCGTCSGASVEKAQQFGISLEDASLVTPKRVAGCRLVLECRVSQIIAVGDHTLYISEVVGSFGNNAEKGLFAMEGYRRLDTV